VWIQPPLWAAVGSCGQLWNLPPGHPAQAHIPFAAQPRRYSLFRWVGYRKIVKLPMLAGGVFGIWGFE
jgi:hypothetical protein